MQPRSRPPASADDLRLVAALRRGDDDAFTTLLHRYHRALVRLATAYVPSAAEAEEVAQETWLGVLRGIDRFQGRSSLKTWIFRILTNQAKQRHRRERRTVPLSAVWDRDGEPDWSTVDPERFLPRDHDWADHWASPPRSWGEDPETRLLAGETRAVIREAIARLPPPPAGGHHPARR